MKESAYRQILRKFVLTAVVLFPFSAAWGYRPFVSTDAAVADVKEMEIEFGYFNWARDRGKNTFIVPKTVLNYGLVKNLELVGEFSVEVPPRGSVQLADPALSLKGVLKEGVLQEKSGVSFAVEAGPLLPSTNKDENRVGFEAIGIIGELPVSSKLRLVGEINGESVKRNTPDNSALLGFIWQAPWQNVFIDAGIRRGISQAAADWAFTTGLTFSFSIPHN